MKEKETIEYLDLKHLVSFRNHPFKLRDGEEKEQLLKSIKAQGTIEPLIVRPLSESEYEVISGHRRMEICRELGIGKLPVIVRNLTDEQAVSMMVDANLHRENILPSERAFAYKMKWEAAKKSEKALSQPATKLNRYADLVSGLLPISFCRRMHARWAKYCSCVGWHLPSWKPPARRLDCGR